MIVHPIPPVFDENSRVLILGSFPSVKSREAMFYYGHPQNRFWKVLARVFDCTVPEDTEGKKEFLLDKGIALWDVIASCEIVGSSDSSVSNVVPNDISQILQKSNIKVIFANGRCAQKYYDKFIFPKCLVRCIPLPSTSPANATYSLERLCAAWNVVANEIYD